MSGLLNSFSCLSGDKNDKKNDRVIFKRCEKCGKKKKQYRKNRYYYNGHVHSSDPVHTQKEKKNHVYNVHTSKDEKEHVHNVHDHTSNDKEDKDKYSSDSSECECEEGKDFHRNADNNNCACFGRSKLPGHGNGKHFPSISSCNGIPDSGNPPCRGISKYYSNFIIKINIFIIIKIERISSQTLF